jgi:hypothetical protein
MARASILGPMETSMTYVIGRRGKGSEGLGEQEEIEEG